uniref:Uncharacterized protein n=1 Tax=Arundo donax TaxID=35708 RepID=A0A0A9H241_ARUDO
MHTKIDILSNLRAQGPSLVEGFNRVIYSLYKLCKECIMNMFLLWH